MSLRVPGLPRHGVEERLFGCVRIGHRSAERCRRAAFVRVRVLSGVSPDQEASRKERE